jgi:hypothetical protein
LNNILAHGIKLHSILKTNDVIQVLHDNNKITKQIHDKTVEFLNSHNNIAIQNELSLSNHVSNSSGNNLILLNCALVLIEIFIYLVIFYQYSLNNQSSQAWSMLSHLHVRLYIKVEI